MSSWNEILERNAKYAKDQHVPRPFIGTPEGQLPSIFIISCMDPRVPVEELLQIKTQDAVIQRNAGGRAKPALRDLVFLDTLTQGQLVKDLIIIHHTDCGCTHASDDVLHQLLKKTYPAAEKEIDDFWFGTYGSGDLEVIEKTVREDLDFIRAQPLVRQEIKDNAKGYVYDITTGKLSQIV